MKLYTAALGLLVSALGLTLLCACNGRTSAMNGNTPQINGQELPRGKDDNVPRITVAQARQAMENGEAFFVDTRSVESYNAQHIRGAINIPMAEAAARMNELPKGKLVIAYCS